MAELRKCCGQTEVLDYSHECRPREHVMDRMLSLLQRDTRLSDLLSLTANRNSRHSNVCLCVHFYLSFFTDNHISIN